MQDNITIPKEQLDLMVTKANMELIARLDTLITRLEQQQTKKEWVGLTDEERIALWGVRSDGPSNSEIRGFAKSIEAKLKEKNT